MNQPKVGDLVVAWDVKKNRVNSYKGYAIGTLVEVQPEGDGQLPFKVKKANANGDDPYEWFDRAQTIIPEQVIAIINGDWQPEEPLKEGDLVVV